MPRQPGPDPSQRAPRRQAVRPGDDAPLAAELAARGLDQGGAEPDAPTWRPEDFDDVPDEELLRHPWRAEAGHVGDFPQGATVPAGEFADASWVRYLLRLGRISPVAEEDEEA